jgi:hypothetical protein
MLMPHLCNDHKGVMSCDGCEGALEFGKNFLACLAGGDKFQCIIYYRRPIETLPETFTVNALEPV